MSRRLPVAGDLAAEFLPHAAPFVLLDRILAIDHASGRFSKCVATDDPLVGPTGVLSPILLVEAMAQGAGIVLALEQRDSDVLRGAVLAAIDRCEIMGSVKAGDLLVVEISVVRRYATMARIRGHATVGARTCATAALTLALAPDQSAEGRAG